MTFDPKLLKLGRRAVKTDTRTLKLARYLTPGVIPTPPASVDYGAPITDWGMLGNNVLGDCTCAALLHAIMLWSAQDGQKPRAFTDSDAIALYSKLCGYVPGDPATDRGGVELDILTAWRASPIEGVPLAAFVSVDPKNWLHVQLAHWLFGTLYMGLNLPITVQNEEVWSDLTGVPGSWGGHAVATSAYHNRTNCMDADTLTAITWGTTQVMTRQWLAKYCDELYAPLSPTWLGTNSVAPNGFNLAQLQTDLTLV